MQIFNRNHLKIMAALSMIIDHVGCIFFPSFIVLRFVGRLAFPIFAFFIAKGMLYTKNRKKYFLLILIFAIISQGIVFSFTGSVELNILFTFLFSIIMVYLIEKIKENKNRVTYTCFFVFANFVLLMLYLLKLIDYGIFGVYVPVVFYFFKKLNLQIVLFSILNVFIALPTIIFNPCLLISYSQLFALASIPLFYLYNGKKGKINLKYFFYIFYPLHLAILYTLWLFV